MKAVPHPQTILHDLVDNSRKLAETSKANYHRDITKWIRFAGTDPSNWTWKTATAFYESMIKEITINSANRVMKSIQYAARARARLEQDPKLDFISGVELLAPSDPRVHRRALRPEDAAKLLEACKGTHPSDLRDYAIVVMGLETGMRRMSLAGMTIEGLSQDARLGHPVARVPIKGKPDWSVPLSPTALHALKPWLRWMRDNGTKTGAVFQRISRFRNMPMGPLSPQSIYNIVTLRAERAGLPAVHPHIFRHTFITWRREAGVPDWQIAAVTGHTVDHKGDVKMLSTYTDSGKAGSLALVHTPPWLTKSVRDP